jgi:hypothetical protein
MVDSLGGLSSLVAVRFERDFAGLSVFQGFADTSCAGRAWVTLLFLRLDEIVPAEEHAAVEENLAAFQAEKVRGRCITLFITQYPGYKYIFSIKPQDIARVAEMTQDERQLLSERIMDFMRTHPECADALNR